MLQLSKRLLAVADLAGTAKILADVGTDHGYIPVYLATCGKIEMAIAMDINQGPLMRAQEHIRFYGLNDRIEARLSDGLLSLQPGEADVIVIAGMGGALMTKILSEGEAVAVSAKRLVLQPQSEIFAFRCFLLEHGYQITAENMVYEDGKFYSMMAVEPGSSVSNTETERFCQMSCKYGPLLIKQRHPVLLQYLKQQKDQKKRILSCLNENARQDVSGRREEILKELAEIGTLLELWKEK